jgi:hypothetical protein
VSPAQEPGAGLAGARASLGLESPGGEVGAPRPPAVDAEPGTTAGRGASGAPEELAACALCGLLAPRPPPRVCPACGAGSG